MSDNSPLYSFHAFLFPFQWNYTGKKYANATFEEKTDLQRFKGFLKNSNWVSRKFELNTMLNYNEYNYFHDFVRDIVFDTPYNDTYGFMANYFYDVPADTMLFRIDTGNEKAGSKKVYDLHIDSILLHLYNTGVGILSFHLNNRLEDQAEPEDIIRINQYGRRLYPPFFGVPFDRIGNQRQFQPGAFEKGLQNVQGNEVAKSISIGPHLFTEDFSNYCNADFFHDSPFHLPKHLAGLFKGVPVTTRPRDKAAKDDKVFIHPLLGDRMFVVSWYGNNDKADKLKTNSKKPCWAPDKHLTDDWWYRYVFVDGGLKTCQNDELTAQLMRKHTNIRWANFGTLFGISRYSFVCLTSNLETLKKPPANAPFLVNHVQTLYYKLSELALLQRACMLRFSDEVADISAMQNTDPKLLSNLVGSLYKQYIRFINRIYFREATPEEQGIELYDKLKEVMLLDDDVKELDREIEELHNYVQIQEEAARNRNVAIITRAGAIFIIPTFITGFLGMNIFTDQKNHLGTGEIIEWLPPLLVVLFMAGAISLVLWHYPKIIKEKSPILKIIVFILAFFVVLTGLAVVITS